MTEFERPLLVEAGAGTGKTALLVARVLAWSLGPGWEQAEAEGPGSPHEVAGRVASGVVAITFTEKAAAEMGTRLAEGLARVLSGTRPPGLELASLPDANTLRQRAQALLAVLDRYVLCTIHAFGLRLLSRYPLEAGLRPEFQVDAEGWGVARSVEEAVLDFLAEPPPQLWTQWQALASAGIGPMELRAALEALVVQGVAPESLARLPLENQVEGLASALRLAFAELSREIGELARETRLKKANQLWELADRLGSSDLPAEVLLQLVAEEVQGAKVLPKLRDWANEKFGEIEKRLLGTRRVRVQQLSALLKNLCRAATLCQPRGLRAFLALGEHLLRQVLERVRGEGLVTYQDLLTGSVRLLVENPHIARRERLRIKQLLVDEFQDTDRVQGELVEVLALVPETPRPGLFLVGDPKQSIYGWRSADLAVYDRFKDEVRRAGGEVCPLVVNFRSVPAILEEVERAVAPVMVEEPGLQPAFQRLVPYRCRPEDTGFVKGPHRPVEYWVCWEFDHTRPYRKTRLGDARRLEAKALAHHLRELHEEHGVSYSHMAVLLRAFSDADLYLEAMRDVGIPYATTHDPTYYRRREVLDAACLLQAVADPDDELSLVGFLRSPWAGIPDAAWWELKARGFFPMVRELHRADAEKLSALRSMLEEVAAALPADMPGRTRIVGWQDSVLWALTCLALLRQSFQEDPADVFIARVRSWLFPEATEAARFPGRVRVANLERFFRLLLAQKSALQDPKELVRALRRAVEEAQEEAGSRPPEAEDAVLVTTIHQAKGLDFPFVFLADVARSGRGRGQSMAGAWWLHRQGGEELVLQVGPLATPNLWQLGEWQERVAAAETVRLLYVAMTRARERLVVSGHWPEEVRGESLVGLLAARRDLPDLDKIAGALAGQDRVEAGGALWVFPGAQRIPEARPAKPARSAVPVAELARTVQRLQAERAQALRRQGLPLSAPVSAEAHEQLRELLSAPEEQPQRGATAATVAGTLVHRVLQIWDFARDPAQELARHLECVGSYLPPETPPDLGAQGQRWAQEVLERFAGSPLFEEFCGLGHRVLGREVPVLLAGDGRRVAGFYGGAIDLVYREGGQVVVVDFKTDAVTGEALKTRARAYRSQGALYARAVRDALGLRQLPCFELWFLWPGQKVRFSPGELDEVVAV